MNMKENVSYRCTRIPHLSHANEQLLTSLQAFGECFQPLDSIGKVTLIDAESCSQRLQALALDKYLEKFATSFAPR